MVEVIPEQLRDLAFSFIAIARNAKTPIQPGWQKSNLKFNDSYLCNHISTGGNIGIRTGVGKVYILDIDKPTGSISEGAVKVDVDLKDFIIKRFGSSFIVRTRSGGTHYYVKLTKDTKKIVLNKTINGERVHFGELQADGQQCLIPPSKVIDAATQETGYYTVEVDMPIITIDTDEFLTELSKFKDEEKVKLQSIPFIPKEKYTGGEKDDNVVGKLSVKDIISKSIGFSLTKTTGNGDLLGVGPHERRTGTSFAMNDDEWYCWRCNCGGGRWGALGLAMRLTCDEASSMTEEQCKIAFRNAVSLNIVETIHNDPAIKSYMSRVKERKNANN